MSSAPGHFEYSKKRLSRPKSGPKHGVRPDAELTEFLVPPSAGPPRTGAGDRAQDGGQQSMLSRYSNVGLPEVVTPRPTSNHRAEIERTLSAEQLKSRESNKCFVPACESASPQNERSNHESESQLLLSSPATQLYTISHLIFFSILGTLARLGVEAITFYPSAPVTSSVLWSNFTGSLMLGFLAEDQRIFRDEWGVFSSSEDWSFHPTTIESEEPDAVHVAARRHANIKKTIPLFIGLATGFCGSFTSFSSFMRDAFLALSNELPSPSSDPSSIPSRNGAYSFEALLAILILHTTVSLSALKLGAHIALAVDPIMPTLPFRYLRSIVDRAIVFLGFGSWIGAVLLSALPPDQVWRGRVTYALLFAPLGCLVRFYVSKHLNPRISSFPLGTFAVNMFGTIVLGACFDLQHSNFGAGDMMACRILEGVMEGFCGCVTTVSTWVAELNGLKRKHSYIYGLTSVVVALSFLISIMGSLQWSQGFQEPACT
jgi:fluoride exporter